MKSKQSASRVRGCTGEDESVAVLVSCDQAVCLVSAMMDLYIHNSDQCPVSCVRCGLRCCKLVEDTAHARVSLVQTPRRAMCVRAMGMALGRAPDEERERSPALASSRKGVLARFLLSWRERYRPVPPEGTRCPDPCAPSRAASTHRTLPGPDPTRSAPTRAIMTCSAGLAWGGCRCARPQGRQRGTGDL